MPHIIIKVEIKSDNLNLFIVMKIFTGTTTLRRYGMKKGRAAAGWTDNKELCTGISCRRT